MKCPRCNGTGKLEPGGVRVGDMILAARQMHDMTQDDLAKKVGMSRAQIANLEGGRSDTTIKRLGEFAAALGCSPRDLMPE